MYVWTFGSSHEWTWVLLRLSLTSLNFKRVKPVGTWTNGFNGRVLPRMGKSLTLTLQVTVKLSNEE